jgi:hypothetical protein
VAEVRLDPFFQRFRLSDIDNSSPGVMHEVNARS